MRQSIQASTPASSGDPVPAAGRQSTPANLSVPLRAKDRHRLSWPAARTLTQKAPAERMRGQVTEVRATVKATSGGSSEREVKDWQVKPTGRPVAASTALMTVTPLPKCPSTARNWPVSVGTTAVGGWCISDRPTVAAGRCLLGGDVGVGAADGEGGDTGRGGGPRRGPSLVV